ncbi:MAG: hypothetical protein Q9223_007183 [Gallowayella weberi]
MDRYGRPLSPPGGRRVTQPGRSSTGTLIYPSPFDNFYGPTRSSREFSAAAGPRTSADRVLPPRAVPRYRPESPPSRQSRDDYIVRPRRLTLDPDAAETRRPLSTIGPSSPNRASRPVITTSDRPSSPLSKPSRNNEPYFLQPASSTRREHRRNYTVDTTDSSRARDDRDRRDRGGYRSSGISTGRSGYTLNQPLIRPSDDRDRGGYEYTDRREPMYRDTESRPRPRRDSYTGGARERPLSMSGLEEYLPRIERPARDAGPPPSTRGFDALGRSGSLRQGPRDYDASSDFSRDDYERRKAHIPRVALHQGAGDAYAPSRDDESSIYEEPRDLRPRKTVFEDEVMGNKPREPYTAPQEPARRAKPVVDTGMPDLRSKDRYGEDYVSNGEDRSRRHHDRDAPRDVPRDVPRDAREDDRERRRREDAVRDVRMDAPPRDRRDEVPKERRDDPYRERRDEAPREKSHHSDHGLDNGIIPGVATAAATALAAEAARSHHRRKDSRDDRDIRHDTFRESERDRPAAVRDPPESTSTASAVSRDESEAERRERRRRRRERRDREEREARELEERERRRIADEQALPKEPPGREAIVREPEVREGVPAREGYPREPTVREPERRREFEDMVPARDNAIREQPSYERRSNDGRTAATEPPKLQPRGHHHHRSHSRDYDSYSDSDSSLSDASSRRPRNVRVVTPTEERAPSQPPAPKSILRQPREKFPEDPAPVREGVAPLKDAGKKGIPPNARWTKIDRKLVNPEALEAGNERYEERVDHVIVLRVLTKEEIQQYAAKTQELRALRATAPLALPPPEKVARAEQRGGSE